MLKELSNTVVNCKTQEEWNKLMDLLREESIKWKGGQKLQNYGKWEEYKSETCIDIGSGIQVSPRSFYRKCNGEIISLSEFLEKQGLDKEEIVVECKTEVEFKALAKEYERRGWKWLSGRKASCCMFFYSNMCVTTKDGFCHASREWYEGKGRKVVSVLDFLGKTSIEYGDSFEIYTKDTRMIPIITPDSTSFPKPRMSMLEKFKASKLSAGERNLRKTGLRDQCGDWSEEAQSIVMEMLCEEKRDKLEEMAKKKIAEDKK